MKPLGVSYGNREHAVRPNEGFGLDRFMCELCLSVNVNLRWWEAGGMAFH